MVATEGVCQGATGTGQTRCAGARVSVVHNRAMSFDLVLFGGTGDLTWRKLMPALFQAFRHGKLPAGGRILAVARDARSDDAYRQFIKERFVEVDRAKQPADGEFARFAALLHYRRMDLSQPGDYAGLKAWLDERRADTVVMFLATAPHLHYGLKKNGSYVNPIVEHRNMPPGEPVAPSLMNVFSSERDRYLQLLVNNPTPLRAANN